MKVVINRCFGGFSLSTQAWKFLRELGNVCALEEEEHGFGMCRNIKRDDPMLIRAVEELGAEVASGMCAKLRVVEIPDGIAWEIDEYDGMETVDESHQSWY